MTIWRRVKLGLLTAVNIAGRPYITTESLAEFYRRAAAGELAKSQTSEFPKQQSNLTVKICFRSDVGMWFCQGLMSEAPITPDPAWQPITPRGVAAFATASVARLGLAQLLVAAMVAAVAMVFVSANWLPVIREAVPRLPENAAIRQGTLRWTTNTPVRLAENHFLELVVDATDTRQLGRAADVEIALHDSHFRISSLLGFVEIRYPRDRFVSLARAEAIPWWGAWERPLLALFGGGVVLALMAGWFALATLYCPFTRAFTFLARRRLGWWASWKLSGAAQMPGAFVVVIGLCGYGWLGMDLFQLGLFYLLHFITSWAYLATSPFFLPKEAQARTRSANPFLQSGPPPTKAKVDLEEPPAPPGTAALRPKPVAENPFAPTESPHPGAKADPENPFSARR